MKLKHIHRRLFASRVEAECFICGCGHSGTTLVANIMAGHADVYTPLGETYIFKKHNMKMQLRYMQLLRQASSGGKRYLIEKTPSHIEFMPVIRANVSDPRFIVPVRDGRDVVASLVRRGVELKTAKRRWLYTNTLVLAEREKPDVHIYRHEDLVKQPTETIRDICQFLGLEYNDALLEYRDENRKWFDDNNPLGALRNWQINQPIFDSSGRWKTELSKADLSELETGHGRYLMQSFGYLE